MFMMEKTYTVRYEKNAQEALKKMDKNQARLILSWISKKLEGTDSSGVHWKGLVGNKSGQW